MVNIIKQNYLENKKIYKQYEQIFYNELGNDVTITHVGSTAIKNMCGKNIIDILIGVNDITKMNSISEKIALLGFYKDTKSKNSIYFFFASSQEETKSGDIHVHLVYTKTTRYKDFILMKEYLLDNPKVATKYAKYKIRIINKKSTKREIYKQIKSKYVDKILNDARKYQKKYQPTSITLVRHGENAIVANIDNNSLPLTNMGVKQSMWAKRIINHDFDVIISSTSKRAIDTARIIGGTKNIIINSKLLECGYGNKEHNGKESTHATRKRFKKVLKEINKKYYNKRVLIVAHGGLIKIAQDVIENTIEPRNVVENCSIIKYTRCTENAKLLYYYCHKYHINTFTDNIIEEVI